MTVNSLKALCLLTLAIAPLPASAPVPKATAASEEPAAAKIRTALDETGDVTIDNQTMTDAIAFFKNRMKCEILIDPSVTNLAGIDLATTMVNAKTHGKPHRTALKQMLEPVGFTFAIVGEALVIGSEDALLTRQMRQTVSLDGKAASLAALLKTLADQSGANIVIDPRQQGAADAGKVPLKLDDVPLETAVRLAVEVGGLRTVRMNNVLFITNDARADKLRTDADGPVPMPGNNPLDRLGGGGVGVVPAQAVLPAPAAPAPPGK